MSAWDNEESPVGVSPILVNLPAFDGPLDLLLHLIKRDEINIYDIPIAHITEQYLAYIGMMRLLDLDVAGEFLVMAASLMRIKARMLLPPAPGQAEEEDEDPRDELVRQLLEYRRFKEAAGMLQSHEDSRRRLFERGVILQPNADQPAELMPVSLFTLIDVMKDVLARVGEEFFHEVVLEEVTLEEKIALIEGELAAHGRVLFRDLIERFPRRMHVVVTLMAILELSRLSRISVRQEALFGQIWIYRANEAPVSEMSGTAPDESSQPQMEPATAVSGPVEAQEEDTDGTT